jgi:hypothetical protein
MTEQPPLDDFLAAWAKAPVTGVQLDVAAITAQPQLPPLLVPARRWPWLAGGAAGLAAAVAAVFMIPQMAGSPPPASTVAAAAPAAATPTLAEAEDKAAFASVFTPTDAEEDLI